MMVLCIKTQLAVDEPVNNMPSESEAPDTVDVLQRFADAHEDSEDGVNTAPTAERAIVRVRKVH